MEPVRKKHLFLSVDLYSCHIYRSHFVFDTKPKLQEKIHNSYFLLPDYLRKKVIFFECMYSMSRCTAGLTDLTYKVSLDFSSLWECHML